MGCLKEFGFVYPGNTECQFPGNLFHLKWANLLSTLILCQEYTMALGFFCCCCCCCLLFWTSPVVPGLRVEYELQVPAYTTTAMWDQSHVFNLHHNSWQLVILNPPSEARIKPTSSGMLIRFVGC